MKKKIIIKRFTAFTLAAVMSAQIFAGCSSGNNSDNGDDDNSPIKAASVAFSENGDYKTTITSSEIDLSSLKIEDVSVTYNLVDKDGYDKAVEKAEKEYEDKLAAMPEKETEAETKAESESDTAQEPTEALPEKDVVSMSDYIKEKSVDVKNVKAEKDKLEISFNDPAASDNMVGCYNVHLNGKKYGGEDVVVDLGVEYKEYDLTPNIKSVLSNAEETRLTLTLNDGSFADKVTKDDITLSGSFEKMKIDSLSCSGKNLTMQLTGKSQKPQGLTTYVDGCVAVKAQAVKGAGSEIKTYVPIELVGKSLDASTIKADGGKITAELELVGTSTPLEKLTPDDFKFEKDVTVTGVKKVSGTRVELTMTVNGATDATSAAAVLNNQKLKMSGEDEITVSAAEAHFYPVFDGIEASGSKLKFTIIAYASNGSFSNDIKPEQISLGDDFKDGSVESVERQNDSSAKIIFTIPANGQKAESLDVNGKITLKAGAMLSQWGEPTAKDSSYTRNYSQESMGRGKTWKDFQYIRNYIDDYRDPENFYRISWEEWIEYLSYREYLRYDRFEAAAHPEIAAQINESFLRNYSQIMRRMPRNAEVLDAYVRGIHGLYDIELRGLPLQEEMALSYLRGYHWTIEEFVKPMKIGVAISSFALAASVMSLCAEIGIMGENKEAIDAVKETEKKTEQVKEMVEEEYHKLCNLKGAQLKAIVTECDVRIGDLRQSINMCSQYFNEKSREDLGVDTPKEIALDGEITQFGYDTSVALTDACRRKEAGYENYHLDFNELQEQFELLCNLILLDDGADPLTALDQAYANIDNFSTTSYYAKKAYRLSLINLLDQAYSLINMYKLSSYNLETDEDGNLLTTVGDNGEEVYITENPDAYDKTDEDLYRAAQERLITDGYTYDDGWLENFNKYLQNIDNEEIIKSTEEYKKMYKTFYNRPWLCDFLFSMQNPDLVNVFYNYKLENIDFSDSTNPLFAQLGVCVQLANIKVNTKGTGIYKDENSHWGTREYSKFWTYSQEPGSSITHTDEAAKPYCYSLNTTVTCVDNCYYDDDVFRAYTNYKDYQIAEFFNRLKDSGRNLAEELTLAGIRINKDYVNLSKERGNGGDNYDPNNLYGIALEHSTASKYDAWKARNSWNTYTKLYYWDAKSRTDACSKPVMVWRGLSNEARNKVAILIP